MEFPEMGVQCSISDCRQLDFLPFKCSYCQLIFCKEHFHIVAHACSKAPVNTAATTELLSYYCCTNIHCNSSSPIEMLCVKCKLHFCIVHRHHGCLDIGEDEKLKQLEKWNKPKEEFLEAKATIDKHITNSLRKAKNSAIAQKVQLMRLKSKAVGFIGIPTEERRYFLVYPPVTGSSKITDPKATYTCALWSLGRTIDTFADTLGIQNTNNTSKNQKLRLFHQSTGSILSQQMDILVSELLSNSSLIDGESLILEYSDSLYVETNLYQ